MTHNLITATVTMTEDTFQVGEITTRRWRGHTAGGTPVVMLVQSIRPVDDDGMKPLAKELGVDELQEMPETVSVRPEELVPELDLKVIDGSYIEENSFCVTWASKEQRAKPLPEDAESATAAEYYGADSEEWFHTLPHAYVRALALLVSGDAEKSSLTIYSGYADIEDGEAIEDIGVSWGYVLGDEVGVLYGINMDNG